MNYALQKFLDLLSDFDLMQQVDVFFRSHDLSQLKPDSTVTDISTFEPYSVDHNAMIADRSFTIIRLHLLYH